MLDLGLFVVLLTMSLGFLVFTLVRHLGTISFIFRIFSFVMFLALALFISTGQDVGKTTVSNEVVTDFDGNVLTNSTNTQTSVFIDGDTGSWIGWIFFGLALFSAILFIRDMFG